MMERITFDITQPITCDSFVQKKVIHPESHWEKRAVRLKKMETITSVLMRVPVKYQMTSNPRMMARMVSWFFSFEYFTISEEGVNKGR